MDADADGVRGGLVVVDGSDGVVVVVVGGLGFDVIGLLVVVSGPVVVSGGSLSVGVFCLPL